MAYRRFVDVWPALQAAGAEAERQGHPHVGSEHIALVALGSELGLEALARSRGIDPAVLRPALDACCPATGTMQGEPVITPRTARMFALAAQVALVDGHGAVEPIDLIFTLMTEPTAVAWQGILSAGLTPHDVRGWLRAHLATEVHGLESGRVQ